MCDNNAVPEVSNGDDATAARIYGLALVAGVLLIIFGNTSPVEASGFVSPFLVMFEQRR
ncbi:hypothetical protein OG586_37310 [Streptomyces murinus]|uniref:hypothetical protein n=1 Tax=Streptomyces murinus TaxID=33900 RepID=UPI002E8182B8|nr:hypothetical protein [Streptomyces murinus]WUD04733.1 hypothetical protein OG586_00140 [Streptomyces murinus]WUD11494.1 hypothetical protein OG586_37310 [Streptomyces murinus]